MLATTLEIIRSGLRADPSLTSSDRARLLAVLRKGVAKSEDETSAERVARIILRMWLIHSTTGFTTRLLN
jgi:hypothetical protein